MKTLDIIIPCYNEAESLNIFYNSITEVLKDVCIQIKYIFIDDGSVDNTLDILKSLSKQDNKVKYISFSKNFGKEAAMYAGLKNSSADVVLIMDADMQNPPALIPKMLDVLQKEDFDCCAGYRKDRKGEARLRTILTNFFYKITNKISEVNMPNGAGDFRMMKRKVVNAILSLSEVQRFSKGIFSFVGFKTKWIPFENAKRVAGSTKWSFFSLFSYAIDGITAFSTFPLKIASVLGILISFSSFIYLTWIVFKTLIYGKEIPGYASLITIVLFIGGIIIISCGIIGEYIGRIYLEVKNRPIYITNETNLDYKTEEL